MNRGAARAFALAAAVAVAIAWLSLRPAPDRPPRIPHEDKVKHCAAYAVLAASVARSLGRAGAGRGRAALAAFAAAAAYGAALEVVQPSFGRSGEVADEAANAAGAALGAAAWWRRPVRPAGTPLDASRGSD